MQADSLALYLALRRRGIDVHEYGSAVLEGIRNAPPPTPEPDADNRSPRDRFADFVASSEAIELSAPDSVNARDACAR